jgi:hypothetical protein
MLFIISSVTNLGKHSLRSVELDKWIRCVNNVSSRSHDPVQPMELLRHCAVESLLDAECILEVLNELKDEIYSAREDFLHDKLFVQVSQGIQSDDHRQHTPNVKITRQGRAVLQRYGSQGTPGCSNQVPDSGTEEGSIRSINPEPR